MDALGQEFNLALILDLNKEIVVGMHVSHLYGHPHLNLVQTSHMPIPFPTSLVRPRYLGGVRDPRGLVTFSEPLHKSTYKRRDRIHSTT